MSDLIHGLEVAKHNTKESCWVIVKGKVYDVTEYMPKHPGGSAILLQYGGKDATSVYEPIHPEGTIEKALSEDKHLGPVDPATVATVEKPQVSRDLSKTAKIPLSHCMNIDDIEMAAERLIDPSSWAYFHSAADSLGSLANNKDDWKKVTLRPRIMRNVKRVNMQRTMLGAKSRLPFFIAPAARAKLVHNDGELCLARGAARAGIPYCPSTHSTIPHKDLAACMASERARPEFGTLWFQLYVDFEKEPTIERITMARELGFTALVITVDTPVVGKREEDERYRAELATASGDDSVLTEWYRPQESEDGPPLRGHHSSTLNWDDLPWIKAAWQNAGPIVLKGIQTAEDAALAVQHGVDAIYLSNHGGRQCDDAPSSIRTLLEIRRFYPHILGKVEIFLDGWVRRGADVIKALCLGATGVALGRPFMYSVSMGDEGVMKVIQCKSSLQEIILWFVARLT
jgi:L-lactate dehydrogenase (cytochrome)